MLIVLVRCYLDVVCWTYWFGVSWMCACCLGSVLAGCVLVVLVLCLLDVVCLLYWFCVCWMLCACCIGSVLAGCCVLIVLVRC